MVNPKITIPNCKNFVASDLLIKLSGILKINANPIPIKIAKSGDPTEIAIIAKGIPIYSLIKYALLIKLAHCRYEI